MERVLVLNASFEPLSVVSIKRAVVLLVQGKAKVVEDDVSRQLRAERVALAHPLVIRLVHYVTIPFGLRVPLSRKTLLARDRHTCQYCGNTSDALTVDHVLPRSRGGRTSWENCVAACARCNHRKGNRTPKEAGMTLRKTPGRPRFDRIAFVIMGEARGNEVFQRYIT